LVTVPKLAEIIAQDETVRDVVNVNVAESEPTGMVMEAGRVKPELVDARVTVEATRPTAVKVTEQLPLRPGVTVVGKQESTESEYGEGESAMGKVTAAWPAWARTVAFTPEAMAPARAENSAELEPSGTVTEAGTVSTGELLLKATGDPPVTATWFIRTTHVVLVFGVSVVSAQVRVKGTGVPVKTEICTTRLLPPREIVSETVWSDEIAPAVRTKLVVVDPAATVAEDEVVRTPVGLAVMDRRAPPAGADLEIVTVQVVDFEASRPVLAQEIEETVTGTATVKVTVLLTLLTVAVRAGVWSEITAAAVAVKVAVEAAAGTVTDPGTVSAPVLLLERVTVEPPLGAALERVTVHVVEAEAVRVVLPHWMDDGVTGAPTSDRFAVLPIPFRVAVRVADWSVVKDPAVTLNVALAAFAAIETLGGAVMLPVELRLTVVLVAAGLLNVTVQPAVAPEASEERLQEMPLSTELTVWVAVPLVAVTLTWLPLTDAPSAPETPMAAEVALFAKVMDTVATVPLAMTLELIPLARQMYAVAEPEQLSVFPAAVRAGPALAAKAVTEAAG
jgi:hypothetical protein